MRDGQIEILAGKPSFAFLQQTVTLVRTPKVRRALPLQISIHLSETLESVETVRRPASTAPRIVTPLKIVGGGNQAEGLRIGRIMRTEARNAVSNISRRLLEATTEDGGNHRCTIRCFHEESG